MRKLDITGQTNNRLTAIRDITVNTGKGRIWEFKCECGKTKVALAKKVRAGEIKSCGCLAREHAIENCKKYRHLALEKLAPPLPVKFARHVDWTNRPEPTVCKGFGPCLLWTGATNAKGRAIMGVDGKTRVAAHVAWFIEYGYWPTYLCHRCDNVRCINVNHLFEGDHSFNNYDRRVKELGGVMVS